MEKTGKKLTMMLLAIFMVAVNAHAVYTDTSTGTTLYFVVNDDGQTATIVNKEGDLSDYTWSTVKTSYSTYGKSYSGAVTIPETVNDGTTDYTVTTIGAFAFFYCSSLTSVTLPSTVTTIEDYAFDYGGSTARITKVTSVDMSACTKLSSIGSYAFRYCKSMTSITFPEEVSGDLEIGASAFYGCI